MAGKVSGSMSASSTRRRFVARPALLAARSVRATVSPPSIRGKPAVSDARDAPMPWSLQTSIRQSSSGSGAIRSSLNRSAAGAGPGAGEGVAVESS